MSYFRRGFMWENGEKAHYVGLGTWELMFQVNSFQGCVPAGFLRRHPILPGQGESLRQSGKEGTLQLLSANSLNDADATIHLLTPEIQLWWFSLCYLSIKNGLLQLEAAKII